MYLEPPSFWLITVILCQIFFLIFFLSSLCSSPAEIKMKPTRSRQKNNHFSPLEPANRLTLTASCQLSQVTELNESSQIKLGHCVWCNPPNIHVQSFHFIYDSQLFVDCWIPHKGMYRSQAKCEVSFFFAFSLCIPNIIPNKTLTLFIHENMWCYLWEENKL